jgi:hypothetical protein
MVKEKKMSEKVIQIDEIMLIALLGMINNGCRRDLTDKGEEMFVEAMALIEDNPDKVTDNIVDERTPGSFEIGDLVEVEHETYNRTYAPKHLVQGIVVGTEKDDYMITDHVDVNRCIIPISTVKRIVKKNAIPKEMMEHLQRDLFTSEKPPATVEDDKRKEDIKAGRLSGIPCLKCNTFAPLNMHFGAYMCPKCDWQDDSYNKERIKRRQGGQ